MANRLDYVVELLEGYDRGVVSRRQLFRTASALGLSVAALTAISGRTLEAMAAAPDVSSRDLQGFGQDSAEPRSAALVTAQKTGDLGPVDAMVTGLQRGATDLNYEVKVVEVVQGEYSEAVRALASSGTDLVIAAFPPMIDAIVEVAPEFPNQHFSLIVGETPEEIPNVMSYWHYGLEACFLAGALAGLYTSTGIVGAVIATRNPEQDRYLAGYQQGVRATNKDAKVLFNVIGGENPFEDPATAKRLALVLHEQGADVIAPGGGQSVQGILEAAADSNGSLTAIGLDQDHCPKRPKSTLASGLIYTGGMLYGVMKADRENQWQAGNFLVGLAKGAEDICTFDDTHLDEHAEPHEGHEIGPGLPASVRNMIWGFRDQIKNGTFEVKNELIEY